VEYGFGEFYFSINGLMGLISKNPCLVFLFLFVLVSLICVDLSCEEVDP
jgi:hypothetical protein